MIILDDLDKSVKDRIIGLSINDQEPIILYVEQISNRLSANPRNVIANLVDTKNMGKGVSIAENKMSANKVGKNMIAQSIIAKVGAGRLDIVAVKSLKVLV